jgi:hypothetical protein
MNSGLTKQLNNMVSTWFQNGFLNKVQPAKAVFPLSRTVEGSISKDGLVAHFPRPAVRNLPTCPHRSGLKIQLVLKSLGKARKIPWSMVDHSILIIKSIKMAIENIERIWPSTSNSVGESSCSPVP